MSRLTDNPNDPDLEHGPDDGPRPQAKAYLVMSDEERAKGFVRPVRQSYIHTRGCSAQTRMSLKIAETYAREPKFYGATYCVRCHQHLPVAEFDWINADGSSGGVVGS